MCINTYKGKYPASTVLTQQNIRFWEVGPGNTNSSTHQKYKFQTSFQHKRQVLIKSKGIDELAQYLQEPISQDINIDLIKYWSKKLDIRGMRDLAQMALEIPSIPPISAEPERIFSGTKIIQTIGAVVLEIRHWLS